MPTVRLAETDLDIARCFPVMQQLRPHLQVGGFVARRIPLNDLGSQTS